MPGINFDVLVGSAHLGRLVPKQKVREMVFTGEKISVEDIFSYGGISSIHDGKESMMIRANEIANKNEIATMIIFRNDNDDIDIVFSDKWYDLFI